MFARDEMLFIAFEVSLNHYELHGAGQRVILGRHIGGDRGEPRLMPTSEVSSAEKIIGNVFSIRPEPTALPSI